ncbi:unnamed protein product [Phaedon cochleariae]|uniref:Uncharacterized protein n=1 Tax=Phaedon cochleariae TaxID=80249 RepID=A0A9N9SJM8_PHACE|nr:unnamed protein product [Phaedon cochleariae]
MPRIFVKNSRRGLHLKREHKNTEDEQVQKKISCAARLAAKHENDSALHLIAGASNMEDCDKVAEKLINKNVNVNAQNRQGFTPLHIAIQADNKAIFELLLKQDYLNVNLKTIEEHTPLYYALLKYESGDTGDDSYAACLMKSDIQTNPLYSEYCNSLMQILILNGAENAAIFLAVEVANLNHVNSEGETALHIACSKNFSKLVLHLAKLGANCNLLTNESRQSPLHYAVESNSEDCIKVFIEFNEYIEGSDTSEPRVPCNFNLRDINGDTAISLALNKGYNHLVPVLIEGKADVNIRNGKDFTLLHQAILNEDSKTAIFLLNHGVDINAKTTDYETPLQLAIHCHLANVVDALCTRGVDMSAPDRLGNCALWAALDSDQEEIASILTLVEHRANINIRDSENKTPLHIAIENQHDEIITLLLSVPEIDLSLRDKFGLSPFAAALTFRNNKAAQAILDKLPSAAEQVSGLADEF